MIKCFAAFTSQVVASSWTVLPDAKGRCVTVGTFANVRNCPWYNIIDVAGYVMSDCRIKASYPDLLAIAIHATPKTRLPHDPINRSPLFKSTNGSKKVDKLYPLMKYEI